MSIRTHLYQRTFLAILICGVLFLFVLYVPRMILYGTGVKEPLPILVTMALNILLWFIIVPFGLRLPNGRESFRDYLTGIGLKSHLPILNSLLLGLLAFAVWAIWLNNRFV